MNERELRGQEGMVDIDLLGQYDFKGFGGTFLKELWGT